MSYNSQAARFRWWMLVVAAMATGGCATTDVTRGGGATISEAQAERYDGPKARIAVGTIIDKTGDQGKRALDYQLRMLGARGSQYQSMDAASVTGGIRDMLTTALFNSNRYIVLERGAISDVLVEQEFSASRRVGDATRIPMGQIEGAELLVVGALTGFDAGASGGGGFPIPIPLNKRGDYGVLDVKFKKGYASMDVRVIDLKTSRIVASVAVEGSATKFGAGLTGHTTVRSGHTRIRLPVVLRGFTNTPVEKAMNEMVDAAVVDIVAKTPAVYYHAK